ncbi:MAG TPA: efflux RND transporter periplasmic adaptor subunit [Candidatus Angelobacter sp.]
MKRRNRILFTTAALVIAGGLFMALRPKPITVQTAAVSAGPLQQTLDEEAKTRMHDHFVMAASVAGKLRRIELHAGDPVRAGQIIAWVDPTPIDPRETAVLQARLAAARATQQQADAEVGRAKAENDQAALDLERTRKLFEQGVASKESCDKAVNLAAATGKQLEAATSKAQSAAYQVKEAHAALMSRASDHPSAPVPIQSPVSGRVLRLLEQSERVVTAGTPLVEIGYTPKLEIVADYLTRDAVQISPGMDALIEDWGGDKALRARVRTVEPGGFTKISALGVEEQRANVVLDFVDGSDKLADAYRVEVRVITWQAPNVLKVPSSAVFRSGEEWALFIVRNGVAHQTTVKLGHRGAAETEVMQGVTTGDSVIIHPSAEVKEGIRVALRFG